MLKALRSGDAGVTITGLIIGLSVAGVVIALIQSQLIQLNQIHLIVGAATESVEATEEISRAIRDPVACAQTFSGLVLPADSSSVVLPSVKSALGENVVTRQQKYGEKILLSDLTFRNSSPAEGGVPAFGGAGLIVVQATLDLRPQPGLQVRRRSFRVWAKTSGPLPSPIVSCSAGSGGSVPALNTYLRTSVGPANMMNCEYLPPAQCRSWNARCAPGDLPIGGDCVMTGVTDATKVDGDLGLLMPGGVNCGGCPNDPATCDPICNDLDYENITCHYYDGVHNNQSGARVLCLRR